MRIKCPHCGTTSHIRTSRAFSEITREASVQCPNVECAHTWVVTVTASRTIAPSMCPNPRVYIPLSKNSPAAKSPAESQMELPMDYKHPRLAAAGSG